MPLEWVYGSVITSPENRKIKNAIALPNDITDLLS